MSYLARAFSHEAEVRLLRWSDSPRGATITLELPPLEIGQAHPFKGLEGARFLMGFDPIRDDETVAPVLTAVPISSARDAARERYRYTLDSGQKAVVRASLLCKEEKFWRWQERVAQRSILGPVMSAQCLRETLGIKSRSEIASNEAVYRKFLDLEFAYRGHAEQRG